MTGNIAMRSAIEEKRAVAMGVGHRDRKLKARCVDEGT